MSVNIFMENERKNNRFLLTINWIILFLAYTIFIINKALGLNYISYTTLLIFFPTSLLLCAASEYWHRYTIRTRRYRHTVKYLIIFVIATCLFFILASTRDPFLLGGCFYLFIAAALYYNSKLIFSAALFNLLSIVLLVSFNFLNLHFKITQVVFYVDIFGTSLLAVLLLWLYAKKSREIIEIVNTQQEQLADLNQSLEAKVEERTSELQTLNEELVAQQEELMSLNHALTDSNEQIKRAYQELSAAESQLIQNEKMASLGMLVAGVAHEINNPLGAINNNIHIYTSLVKIMEDKCSDNSEIADIIENLSKVNQISLLACERITRIVHSLKSFARLDEADYKEADIHECIDNTLVLLEHRIKNSIEIVKEYGNIPIFRCYPNQLNQVFMNIISNAIDAIKDKGTIWIKTHTENDKIYIKLGNDGKPIEPQYLNKIFDPGFTTKGVGVGTGLGLSIVYNIIEKHSGRIKVTSDETNGTEFTIELPLNVKPT